MLLWVQGASADVAVSLLPLTTVTEKDHAQSGLGWVEKSSWITSEADLEEN